MTQYARPTSDTSTGSWTATPLWSKVDDDLVSSPSGDGSTIASADNTAGDAATLALGPLADPGVTSGHVIRVRWNKSASGGHNINALCELLDSTNGVIGTISVTGIGNTEQENTYTLSAAEAGNITNYGSSLSVRLTRNGDTGGSPAGRRSLVVEAFQFEVPDATVSYTLPADAGSFTLSGIAAGLRTARDLAAGAGAYALSGQAAALTHGPSKGTAASKGTTAISCINKIENAARPALL